jgi:two-component sensor histidine kinase
MINLQLQEENETHTKNILRDTQNRVLSMAMIHQTLYQNKNYSSINISDNLLQLIQNILYSFNKTEIDVQTNIEGIVIDVNIAIPISLILNEALTNVVKYAFPPHFKEDKKVEITLKRNLEHLQLIIKDNGIGTPEQIIENSKTIGFSIIRALSEQMNAELFINSKPNQGTEIKVLIPQL